MSPLRGLTLNDRQALDRSLNVVLKSRRRMAKKPCEAGMLEPVWSETGLLCQVSLLILNSPFMFTVLSLKGKDFGGWAQKSILI